MSCQWCDQWRCELGRVSLALAETHRAGREMVQMAVEVEVALSSELARLRDVAEAARALYDVVDPTDCYESEHCALGVALSALDGST